jgi:nicotinamide-nucleotide amidase
MDTRNRQDAGGGAAAVESLAVGDEILRGEIVDTNSAYLAGALLRAGLRLCRAEALPDDEDILVEALRGAAARSSVLVVSGGLGPTADDRTAAAASRAFGRPLCLHEPSLERIRALFASRGYPLSPNNEKQAWVPEGAVVIENPVGTAPAFSLEVEGAELFFLPGVPREYRKLVDAAVLPRLARRRKSAVRARTLHTLGATESGVDHLLADLPLSPARLSLRVEGPVTHVILVAEANDEMGAEAELRRAEGMARERLGELVWGADDDTLPALLGKALVDRGWTLGVAESCTGGLVASEVTSVPGSSRYFATGVVAYANDAKVRLLGVSAQVLASQGAVCEETARQMARGIRERHGCDVGIAVTGIAGPEGGTPEKPVGLVHVAAESPVRAVHRRLALPPGRERVRAFAVRFALAAALECIRA